MVSKLQLISNVLTLKRYAAIAIISGTGLGIIYYFLTMSMLPSHLDITMEIMPSYIITSVGLTITISALAGINFAMMAFKMKRMKMMNSVKGNSSSIVGGVFAAFTPGCPACTAPLAVVLGAIGGLSLFPMQGLELKFVSVGVLIFSIFWIARGLQSKSCCKIG
ncbi:hypothetical protein NZNM25_18850 [Nitrosopumilus zosterae]|uniref:Uncharacterized protein n=1 Tax=Nitrosopumilus zosterae TaxID=718286 RepID=A0A2S2KTW7_9ARCH|nr:hypothetical protein [Nitrosopumilus zosterae]BDQ31745.1 hypothetical protein NZOSNM25_001880 [Nitrosopumilus zosterae]GBH35094.1 hypothetical protein NZNM25_18850 [Nitrosopumilus zosterae]